MENKNYYEKDGETIDITNEFATVTVKKVYTKNGTRLEISSPKLGSRIVLSAIELESLTWQDKSIFDKFLSDPYGSSIADD
ncbi:MULTISPECIES: hypothetical protein [Acidiplasma]|uniref:Dihydrodiol dehydrogenase n=2 Tax=Acidiplasma TaxID=507753 RepID=A0A0Q0WHV9_9ARCH|nr:MULTISPECIES: hypothetical protein [Acidiplasma]KPV46060.1 hypothetical protein SE19_07200 [Acidiplasma aeolicum]KQB34259.1 hypothetical protein AOG54_05360 [Acidiplasma aeolicum]KQB35120.1 hypothetical protein AOG55_07805 [Acidiplasma cupricumulans]WMT55138.1 MAG: hypothetical protein RE470_00475 [Acidiplasma sp.]